MLGRTYLVSGRADDAVAAYEKASALTGGTDPVLELDLAEALVLTDKPEAKGRARGIIDAALAADENNQKALWYSGLMALRSGDPETARRGGPGCSNRSPSRRSVRSWWRNSPSWASRSGEGRGRRRLGARRGWRHGGAWELGSSAGGGRPGAQRPDDPHRGHGRSVPDRQVAARHHGVRRAREAGIPGPPIAAVRITATSCRRPSC